MRRIPIQNYGFLDQRNDTLRIAVVLHAHSNQETSIIVLRFQADMWVWGRFPDWERWRDKSSRIVSTLEALDEAH